MGLNSWEKYSFFFSPLPGRKKCGEHLQSLDMAVPMDMLIEILLRLPAKSLGRFVCVSKLWAQVIHTEEFIRWYSSRSSQKKQQRFLLAFTGYKPNSVQESWYFFSRSSTLGLTPPPPKPAPWRKKERRSPPPPIALEKQKPKQVSDWEPPEFLSSTVCLLKDMKKRYNKPSHAHGLISFLYGEEQIVCNPTTGKSITLPTVVDSTEMIVRSYLGYDPIDAQYKVLCLTNIITRFCQHQVFTLGSSSSAQTLKSSSWRPIQCSTPHVPLQMRNSSVCIHGVLYYTASTSLNMKESPFVAGFDLRSETLEIASKFPKGILSYKFDEALLINYHGKATLVTPQNDAHHLYSFALWVLKDAKKQEWSKESLSFCPVGPRQQFRHVESLRFVGASDMGEFIFTSEDFGDLHFYFVDQKSNRMRSVQLEGSMSRFHGFSSFFTFFPYVESLMFT